MKDSTRHFLLALQFFSRIPPPKKLQAQLSFDASEQPRLLHYWPAVGVVIGGLCAVLLLVLSTVLSLGLNGFSLLSFSLGNAGFTGLTSGLGFNTLPIAPLAAVAPPRLPSASAFLVVTLCMAFSLWLSGGLHEDGLGDSADGLMGGAERERALTIMQDPHCGSFAVLSLIAVWSLRTALLWQLCMLQPLWAALAWLFAAVGSRSLPLWLVAQLPYARATGSGKASAMVQGFDRTMVKRAQKCWFIVGICIVCGAGLLTLTASPLVPFAVDALKDTDAAYSFKNLLLNLFIQCVIVASGLLFATLPAFLLLRHLRQRLMVRLQGYTGDTLGAAQQLCELALLLGVLLMLLLL